MNIIELNDVSYVYSKGTPFERVALNKINVGFQKGKITGLIGHTGSGKSTLVSLLNGLNKPTEGQIFFEGKNIWDNPRDITKLRFRVGLVMQYPEYQLFDETVRLDVGFGPRNLGVSQEEIDLRVSNALKFAGVPLELYDKSPFELSGGQKRRVAIAGVLAMEPDVLILDEPAAGLDPRGRREILCSLHNLVEERGTTVILVSHSMEDMALYCDNVIVMNKSEIYMTGTTSEVFSRGNELSDVGLDTPLVSHIASELINRGFDLKGELYTVDGVKRAILEYMRRCKK